MAFPQFATQTETETAAFGYRAGVLVFEQRVRRTFGYPRHAPFLDGGRRSRKPNHRGALRSRFD